MLEPDEIEENWIFGTLIEYILQCGKSKKIFIRDKTMLNILYQICQDTGIKLVQSGSLKAIDEFVETFLQNRY